MSAETSADFRGSEWWRHAVIYQIYPRSWADADGDGLGDLPGITARLSHLADLGVDAVWLSPFYPSPQHDAGYDVSDYRDVDPRFGTLADADALVARAHELGLRIIVDIVPNHSSSEHPWFHEALASGKGSAARARYLFRDGVGDDGAEAPNNWDSVFGGPAWERTEDGQFYLHMFDVSQPDFDWTNPEVGDDMERTLRFWFDRGVDGFRIDVANGLVKQEGLPDVRTAARRRGRALQADADVGPAGRARGLPAVAPGRRLLRRGGRGRRPDLLRRGLARSRGGSGVRPPRRAPAVLQLRLPADARGSRRTSARASPARWPWSRRTTPRRRGCSRTTTSCGTPPGWATRPSAARSACPASAWATPSPTRWSAFGGHARRRR